MTTPRISTAERELGEARAIVQRWLDGTERTYPSHRALRELALLLRQERGRPLTPTPKRRTKRTPR